MAPAQSCRSCRHDLGVRGHLREPPPAAQGAGLEAGRQPGSQSAFLGFKAWLIGRAEASFLSFFLLGRLRGGLAMRGPAVARPACLPARGIGLRPLIGSSHPFFFSGRMGAGGPGVGRAVALRSVALAGHRGGGGGWVPGGAYRRAGGGGSVCRVCRHLPGVVRGMRCMHASPSGAPPAWPVSGCSRFAPSRSSPAGRACGPLAQGLRPLSGLPLIRPASRQVRALVARRFRCAPGTRGRVPSSWVLRLCR
jgi:hypothetical protein